MIEAVLFDVAGVVIVSAAGVDTLHGLSRILPFPRAVPAEEAARLLRGGLRRRPASLPRIDDLTERERRLALFTEFTLDASVRPLHGAC